MKNKCFSKVRKNYCTLTSVSRKLISSGANRNPTTKLKVQRHFALQFRLGCSRPHRLNVKTKHDPLQTQTSSTKSLLGLSGAS